MTAKFEKWLSTITEDRIEAGIGKRPELEIFEDNITCWIELPFDLALEQMLKYFKNDYPNPIGWLDHNPMYLELEYHKDDDSVYFGLWIDPNAKPLEDIPESFEKFVRQSYKNIIKKYKDK